MIRSMTGFGQASKTDGELTVSVELKSVNHRFKEVHARLPRPLLYFEDTLKKIILRHVQRGRIELFVTIEGGKLASRSLHIDWPLVDEYMKAAKHLEQRYQIASIQHAHDLLQLEQAVQVEESASRNEQLEKLLIEACEAAVIELCYMREQEGTALQQDCEKRLSELKDFTEEINAFAPEVVSQYKERLHFRMKEWIGEALDESRLITEAAIFADRCDITEEITRLNSHFQQFQQILTQGGAAGRKLDFLVQELIREVNTIGSKANHHHLTKLVVEMKSAIEKIKEQVQNIE
ncbi:YicC/YloC family endoribonuclease [Bacillus sp. 179-C3.3 HS]|uniref:YicC/YloC family endoribonuclease n=1 Tax=Bacillus sp. 179-C3.3 HS TaxID=3232162 RepID=UPI00399F3107